MPELKECPACGSMRILLMSSYSPWFTAGAHVLCADCQMQGPIACSQKEEDAIDIQDLECMAEPTGFEAAAIADWNSLPRALRWTHEPPKVAGPYYLRDIRYPEEAGIVQITSQQADRLSAKGRNEFVQYAGPIAPPID